MDVLGRDPLLNAELVFTTHYKPFNDIVGTRARKFHIILPDGKDKWNFRLLSVFLNELELIPGESRQFDQAKKRYVFISYHSEIDYDARIIIHVNPDLSITVEASIPFILLYMTSIREDIITDAGSQGRKCKNVSKKTMHRFIRTWKINTEVLVQYQLSTNAFLLQRFF